MSLELEYLMYSSLHTLINDATYSTAFFLRWTYKSDVTFHFSFSASELKCARQSQQKILKTRFCSFSYFTEYVSWKVAAN